MSKYTTQLRFICETSANYKTSQGFINLKTIIQNAAPKIFDFDFPIFDENYRLPLEIKILRHYYTREICEETVGLWKLRLQDRLSIIMPYYNQLYKSELLEFNPLYDVDITRDHKKDNEGQNNTEQTGQLIANGTSATNSTTSDKGTITTNTTSETTADSTNSKEALDWDLYSDTPQGGIEGITNDEDSVENNTYLSNARKKTSKDDTNINENENNTTNGTQTNDNTVTGTVNVTTNETNNTANTAKNTITNTEDYLEHVKGKQGTLSYSKMLSEFRETFLNIDKMVIDELSDLFFGLWE